MDHRIPDSALELSDKMDETFEIEDFIMQIEMDPAQVDDSTKSTLNSACLEKIIEENMEVWLDTDDDATNMDRQQQASEMELREDVPQATNSTSTSEIAETMFLDAASLEKVFGHFDVILGPIILAYIDHHTDGANPEKMQVVLKEAESLFPFTCECRLLKAELTSEIEPQAEEPPTGVICHASENLITIECEQEPQVEKTPTEVVCPESEKLITVEHELEPQVEEPPTPTGVIFNEWEELVTVECETEPQVEQPPTGVICHTSEEFVTIECEVEPPAEEPPSVIIFHASEKLIIVECLINHSIDVLLPKDRSDCQSFICLDAVQSHENGNEAEVIMRVNPNDDLNLSEQHILKHMAQRIKKTYTCPQCNQTFNRAVSLRIHVEAVHDKIKTYACSFCGKRFARKTYTQHHEKSQHLGQRDEICLTCGKAFKQKDQLTIHERIHNGTQPYKCTVCGKRFNTRSILRQHMHTHQTEKPFQCSACAKPFKYKRSLYRHFEKEHPTNCDKSGTNN